MSSRATQPPCCRLNRGNGTGKNDARADNLNKTELRGRTTGARRHTLASRLGHPKNKKKKNAVASRANGGLAENELCITVIVYLLYAVADRYAIGRSGRDDGGEWPPRRRRLSMHIVHARAHISYTFRLGVLVGVGLRPHAHNDLFASSIHIKLASALVGKCKVFAVTCAHRRLPATALITPSGGRTVCAPRARRRRPTKLNVRQTPQRTGPGDRAFDW